MSNAITRGSTTVEQPHYRQSVIIRVIITYLSRLILGVDGVDERRDCDCDSAGIRVHHQNKSGDSRLRTIAT